MISERQLFLMLAIYFVSGGFTTQPIGDVSKASPCEKYFDQQLKLTVFSSYTKEPKYPGGPAAWARFLGKNTNEFRVPKDVEDYRTTSFAVVVVKSTGEILRVDIKDKTSSQWTPLDSGFVSILKKSKGWIPGECNGKKVNCVVEKRLVVDLEQ